MKVMNLIELDHQFFLLCEFGCSSTVICARFFSGRLRFLQFD
ncbi:hypothetical protein GPSY_1378 [Paraglaciecola psychrophila 170]|nr:hypothetical protein GPSY_1378 [Paraglaciecola psychrophila 170]